jgi:hypothetical protein
MLTTTSKPTLYSRPDRSKNKTSLRANEPRVGGDETCPVSAIIEENKGSIDTRLSEDNIFTISIIYLEQVFQTKVMKTTYRDNRSIYKIALGSKLSKSTNICWLQSSPQGWTLQMGSDIKIDLINAITLAIEGSGLIDKMPPNPNHQ